MYIGYVDESGYVGKCMNPDQPVQSMACILPSAYNLHKTNNEFAYNLKILRQNNISLSELKAEEIYRGRGAWKNVDGEIRHKIFTGYFDWLVRRKHKIILSLIDNKRFFEMKENSNEIALSLYYPYIAGALHIALSIQKHNQAQGSNKGKTILIFDDQGEFENVVEDIIARPPDFTDGFYSYKAKDADRLNQIIDTAYFVKSHYSYLVQAADTVAFVSRLYLQLTQYGLRESYSGELKQIRDWFKMIKNKLVSRSQVYPKGSNEIMKFYINIAPAEIPF